MALDAHTRILTPISQGRILQDLSGEWDSRLRKYSVGRYRSFRFTAALFGGRGMYFDCRDRDFYHKSFRWSKTDGKLVYTHIHSLPLDGRGDFTLPLPVLFGARPRHRLGHAADDLQLPDEAHRRSEIRRHLPFHPRHGEIPPRQLRTLVLRRDGAARSSGVRRRRCRLHGARHLHQEAGSAAPKSQASK